MSQDLIPIPAGRSQSLTAKVKGTTSPATRALNFTVSSAGFALSVWLCVCFEVTSDVPSTVLTNILHVRKHQFATVAIGSWPNDGAWEGVICVRYMDRMSESDLNTVYMAAAGVVETKSERNAGLNSVCVQTAFHRHK